MPNTPPPFNKAAQFKRERHRQLASGTRPLPNLAVRSVSLLALLYGALGLVLISASELGFISPTFALFGGIVTVIAQYIFGPWIMDLSLRFLYGVQWIDQSELPPHVKVITRKICDEHKISFPSFGLIDDGAPQAFTYGHYPSNARVVLSRGIFELLDPDEVDAVVAHEMGHVCHWDMVIMTIAQLVPLLAYSLYRYFADQIGRGKKEGAVAAFAAYGAYIVYMLSQLVVLWFSRTREFYADRFAGQYGPSPSALASALVKIGYGLASHGGNASSGPPPDSPDRSKLAGAVGFSALNIFDKGSALNLVVTAQAGAHSGGFDQETLKGALQWDLWNPWAAFFEIQSTHPLIAKRLEYLGDQSASLGQDPFVIFDRDKPESYWDEFLVDVVVNILPLITLLIGLGALIFSSITGSVSHSWYPALLIIIGVSSMVKTSLSYRGESYPESTVAKLLQEVKVSPIRPISTTIRGTVVGKGVPGLIWSEDFVIHDGTGIIFLDYRQPFRFWELLFGLLRAKDLQGKDVIIEGWYRRAPIPFIEIKKITESDTGKTRRCYVKIAKLASGLALTLVGIILLVML